MSNNDRSQITKVAAENATCPLVGIRVVIDLNSGAQLSYSTVRRIAYQRTTRWNVSFVGVRMGDVVVLYCAWNDDG